MKSFILRFLNRIAHTPGKNPLLPSMEYGETAGQKAAYKDGFDAEALQLSDNPHKPGSALFVAWDAGRKARDDYEMSIW